MSKVPDAWDDEWPTSADQPTQSSQTETKKLSTKQTKAQKRAAQAEFNRQLWAEAEGPRQTNYFLESRDVVPLRQEFKAAPVLLSRKGPIVQRQRPTLEGDLDNLKLKEREESSEDEEDEATKQKALDKAKAQAARDREEKQRKYEERRLELFGPQTAGNGQVGQSTNRSGGSSPSNNTPSNSRPSTPHRGSKRGRGRGNLNGASTPRAHQQSYQQQHFREVYDPAYAARPGSAYLMRREQNAGAPGSEIQPIREPRAPDGSGKNGAGFVQKFMKPMEESLPPAQASYLS